MEAKKLKALMTIEDIDRIMKYLGADSLQSRPDSNEIQYRTICHCGDSHKLYLYKDSKQFQCYSNCGHMDIINVVERVLNVDVTQSINFICDFLNLSHDYMKEGFSDEIIYSEDWEILNGLMGKPPEIDMSRNFKVIEDSVLNYFSRMYHPSFYNDGISLYTMYKFGIRYDILNHRIIIPHWDEEGNLIAIRCRNLQEHLVEAGFKYMPITFGGRLLSAPTGKYFYGLNFNKENIKRIKKVILVESEKAVMQLDSILEDNIGLSLMSSSLSLIQVELLRELGVEEVIVALDKEYEEYGSVDEKNYAIKIRKGIINKLLPYFNVTVIWDKEDLIGFKDSPTDRGAEIFWKLMNNRIRVT